MVDGAGAGRASEVNSGGRFCRSLKMRAYRRPVKKGVDDAMRSSFGLWTLFVKLELDGYHPVSHGQTTRTMPD